MKIDILSIFPQMFDGPFGHSIVKRAIEAGHLQVQVTNPRDFATDKHKVVDDTPFGGGAGMVMKPEPIYYALQQVQGETPGARRRVILLCPGGKPFTQQKAQEFAAEYDQLVLICGHYEGVDNRIRENVVDEDISIGDYVLTGGELAAMVVTDAVSRLIPGVLGSAASAEEDSFSEGLLEYPQYTRPREFNGWVVPEVLLNGDHAKIDRWRRKESLRKTLRKRPELLAGRDFSRTDEALLAEVRDEEKGGTA